MDLRRLETPHFREDVNFVAMVSMVDETPVLEWLDCGHARRYPDPEFHGRECYQAQVDPRDQKSDTDDSLLYRIDTSGYFARKIHGSLSRSRFCRASRHRER